MPKGKPQPPKEPSEDSYEEEEEEHDGDETIESVDPVEFIKSLTVDKRRRVYALKSITKKYRALRKSLNSELDELKMEFQKTLEPLFETRRQIVSGEREATDEEVAAGTSADESRVEEVPDSDEEKEKEEPKPAPKGKKSVKIASPSEDAAKAALKAAAQNPNGGIPGFWYTTLANNEVCESMIGPKDQEALNFLANITSAELPNRGGFKIEFHFNENPFFENKVLTKTYKTEGSEGASPTDDGDDGEAIVSSEGCEIKWKAPEKNLLVQIKQKKQRHKSGKGVRIIQKEERVESFFWFFLPPYDPEEDEKPDWYPTYAVRKAEPEEDMPSWDEEQELDFEVGIAIHMNVVRRAAHYFSGKSIEEIASGIFASMGGEDDEEDNDEEEEEEEEEEEQEEVKPKKGAAANKKAAGGKAAAPKPAAKECKQQ